MDGSEGGIVVVYVTAKQADAARIARELVERRVAACVNIVPEIRSIYRWDGKIEDDAEALLVVKTSGSAFDRLQAAVLELHPYSVPEILALPALRAHAPYAEWIHRMVGGAAP
jgi:periplasmic divalent cation tolerance protein